MRRVATMLDDRRGLQLAGVESMRPGAVDGLQPMPSGLVKEYPKGLISMGQTAENSRESTVTREQQQGGVTVASHRKAAAATQKAGKLKDEIVPIKSDEWCRRQRRMHTPDTARRR